MDPRRVLLRLNTGTMRAWGGVVPASHVGLTRADVAAGLGYIRDPAGAQVLMAAWLEDPEADSRLRARVLARARRSAQRWRKASPERVRRLAGLVVDETLHHNLCRRCEGRGEYAELNGAVLVRVCEVCRGYGIKGLTDAERARRVGVDPKSWRLVWRHRYQPLLAWLSGQHERALSRLRRVLADD